MRSCTHGGREANRIRERVDADVVLGEGERGAVLEAEFAVQSCLRRGTGQAGTPRRNLQFEPLHVLRADAVLLAQQHHGLGRPLHVDLGRVALDVEPVLLEVPALAQCAEQGVPFELIAE